MNLLLLAESDGPSLLRHHSELVLIQILVVVKIVEKLVHYVLRLLLAYLYHWFFCLHRIFWFFKSVIVHEGVDSLVVFGEFPLFFAISAIKTVFVDVPNLTTIVFIAVSVIIDYEIVVSPVVLSAVVFLGINLLKNVFLLLNLKNIILRLTSY